MTYEIISTGSKGNAVVVNSTVLIDCGVSYKQLRAYEKMLKLVLLGHSHQDHFCVSTLKRLAENRPTLRFGCPVWLVSELAKVVSKRAIDVYKMGCEYRYGDITVIPCELQHNVPNCGYKVHMGGEKLFYATDTNSLSGISAKGYDVYLVEGNHTESEIAERIRAKQETGEYVYEYDAAKNHLSVEKASDFIYQNIESNGEYVFLHGHQ